MHSRFGHLICSKCEASYPAVAGIPDLRLESDRYLSLEAERAKALRLADIAAKTDLRGVAEAYYAMTPDPDPRRCRWFLSHILNAETRGRALAASLPRKGRILELGCGTGGFLVSARKRGLDVTGLDLAARWLVVSQRRLMDAGLRVPLVAASAEELPWATHTFETIVADSLIEHVAHPSRVFAECHRVLKDGGLLKLWSPNRYSLLTDPHVRLWGVGFLPRRWGQCYAKWRRGDVWLPRCLGPSEAKKLAEHAGFVDVAVRVPLALQELLVGWKGQVFGAFSQSMGTLLTQCGPLWELTARKRLQA